MIFEKMNAITCREPAFLKAAYKFSHLVELQNDKKSIKRGLVFITYDDGAWDLWRQSDPPRYLGRYESLNRAVFYGRLKGKK